ncbi:hypothetical protein ABFX02_08G163200 [Erythranthe guttata]
MDNQDQQNGGGGGATKKGPMDGRRRKNEGATTSDESTAESSIVDDGATTTGYLNSEGVITEDGTVDLLKNLIGWPECGDIGGEGSKRLYFNSHGIPTADGTVDLLKCFAGSPSGITIRKFRQGNHGGRTVGLTRSVRPPTEAAGVNGGRNDGGTVGLVKPLMEPPPEATGVNGKRNDGGTAGLVKPLTGPPPETAGSSIGARNVDGRKVASVQPLVGPPPETAGNHDGGTVGLTQSVRAQTEAAGVNGGTGLIKPLMGPPPETAGNSSGARNVDGRKVGLVKPLTGPPAETAGSNGARNGDGTAGLSKPLPETAERSKSVLALPAAEHKSASASWNRKEHQPHRALAANPENSSSKKRKQVIKNTFHEKKSKATGTAAGSPPRNIRYGCSYCNMAWFSSAELVAEHITYCPMRKKS